MIQKSFSWATQRIKPECSARSLLTVLFLILFLFPPGAALNLLDAQSSDPTNESKWLIDFQMDKVVYKKMKKQSGTETLFVPETFIINGTPVMVEEMHTRGKTSLQFWRKSYTVSLRESFPFPWKNSVKEMEKFYLISMSLDKFYFHNRFAFQCLEELGLFPLFYHYAEVRINGESEGLYLIVQRPADYALDDLGSYAILRRGSSDFIAKEKFAKKTPEDLREACRKNFKDIKSAGTNWQGKELYTHLNERMDLHSYFSWLAFNYLVNNGDYTDELFYYLLPGEPMPRFGIIPWDFDDILVREPHEGKEKRNQRFSHQLLFSSEDRLDRTIARDPYLYQQYLVQMENTYQRLTPEVLEQIFADIKEDLRSYFMDPAILAISQHDLKQAESFEQLEKELSAVSAYLRSRWRISRTIAQSQYSEQH
jgi:spore coat protein H